MDSKLQKITELSRDPMLAAEDGKLVFLNAAARKLFPKAEVGTPARELIPEYILYAQSESFLSSAVIDDEAYTVSALRDGDTLLLSLTAMKSTSELRGCLSDGLISSMTSALFNIGLSMDHISAQSERKDPELEKYFTAFSHNYYSLNHRISNLNMLCAFSEGSMSVVRRYADLAVLCRDLAASVNLMIGDNAPQVEFLCAVESLSACVDTPKVERLILNLLSNALKYTPKGGYVRLRLAKSGGNAVISVDDSGCGISPEKLKTVFSSYENRLDEQSLTDPGTGGLGLGICSWIARKHGGAMILESREGEGTSVRVLLPLSQPGDTALRSELSPYENGGMGLLLTELCDVLTADAYQPKYLD